MSGSDGEARTGARLVPRSPAWSSLMLAVVLLGVTAVRLRLLDVPLDRDEGEYAYAAQLLLDGVPPYARAYNMKMPGIYGFYALVLAAFGETTRAVHAGLLVVSALGVVLVFLIARRLAGPAAGVIAAATFAAITVATPVLGVTAYAEHFVLVPALAGLLALLHAIEARRPTAFAIAGALLGLAFVVKQSGGAFAVLGVAHAALVLGRRRDHGTGRSLVALGAGALAPFALVVVALFLAGTLGRFWFWTFDYALRYATAVPLEPAVWHFLGMATLVTSPAWMIYAAAALGLIAVLAEPALRPARAFAVLWLVGSFVAVMPGLYFRRQYFVLLAPAVAFLASLTPVTLARWLPARVALRGAAVIVLGLLPVVHALAGDRKLLFDTDPIDVARALYESNPFPESPEVARYIRARTTAADTIAVVGSEPQIYFHAARRSATGYIYMYPLMEPHPYAARMQREMIQELQASRPKFLVLVNVNTSWLITPRSERVLSDWFAGYWREFERVGLVELRSPGPARFYWDEAARGREPATPLWLAVYRRRADVTGGPLR